MSDVAITRRLAAILAADVAGYSAMMGADEAGTIAALRQIWSETFNPAVAARHGRIVKMMGDGALVEFGSVVDAVECAIAVQRAMGERNLGERPADRIPHRHQSRRHRHRGRRHFRRRRQCRGPPRRPGAAWRHSRLGRRPCPGQRQGRRHLRRCRRNQAQEHRAAGPGVAVGRRQHRACRRARDRFGRSAAADKPSIAVLPFSAMSTDPEQEFFADGLVEDILTTLSKLSGLSVIARNSSFVYKGRAVDVRQVARELGVRYVLEGSIRKAGNRIRITAQLIDADNRRAYLGGSLRPQRRRHLCGAGRDHHDAGHRDAGPPDRRRAGAAALHHHHQCRSVEPVGARAEPLSQRRRVEGDQHPGSPVLGEGAGARSRFGLAQRHDRLHAISPMPASAGRTTAQATIARAEAHVERALAIDPENPDAYRAWAASFS